MTTCIDQYISSASLRSRILALADYYLYDQVREISANVSPLQDCQAGHASRSCPWH